MTEQHGCAQRVYKGAWHDGPCARKGVVEINGKWYCKQHAVLNGWHDESSVLRRIYAIEWSDYDGARVGWLDIRITGKKATIEGVDMRLNAYNYNVTKNVADLTPGNLYFPTEVAALQAAKEITELHIKRHTDRIAKLRYTLETFDVRLMQAEAK